MVEPINILLVGDNEKAPYHPLEAVLPTLKKMLGELGEVTVGLGFEAFKQDLNAYDCLVVYSDEWEETLPATEVESIKTYVAEGGGMVFLHSGVSLAIAEGMTALSGGTFKEHPDMETMNFMVHSTAGLIDKVKSFELYEEPYIYDFDPDVQRIIFLTYDYENKAYPSGWFVNYEQGKTVTLHPGHNLAVFENESYQEVLKSCVMAVCKQ